MMKCPGCALNTPPEGDIVCVHCAGTVHGKAITDLAHLLTRSVDAANARRKECVEDATKKLFERDVKIAELEAWQQGHYECVEKEARRRIAAEDKVKSLTLGLQKILSASVPHMYTTVQNVCCDLGIEKEE